MSSSFAESAVRLYGLSARILGWRPPEFWTATPAELAGALCSAEPENTAGLDRSELNRLMDHDNA